MQALSIPPQPPEGLHKEEPWVTQPPILPMQPCAFPGAAQHTHTLLTHTATLACTHTLRCTSACWCALMHIDTCPELTPQQEWVLPKHHHHSGHERQGLAEQEHSTPCPSALISTAMHGWYTQSHLHMCSHAIRIAPRIPA